MRRYGGLGWTALHVAAFKNNVAVSKVLLENGADVKAKCSKDT